jgi:hypothetical protein
MDEEANIQRNKKKPRILIFPFLQKKEEIIKKTCIECFPSNVCSE